eukprot:scaffold213087_cov17-Tisochrysis_lutea.AAC.1
MQPSSFRGWCAFHPLLSQFKRTRGCSADGGAHSAPGHPARHLWPPGAPAGRQCGAQPGHSTRQRYNGPPGGASAAGAHVLVCVCECARVRCLHFSLHEEAWC